MSKGIQTLQPTLHPPVHIRILRRDFGPIGRGKSRARGRGVYVFEVLAAAAHDVGLAVRSYGNKVLGYTVTRYT